jgi:general L-amino acid transport system permease protein
VGIIALIFPASLLLPIILTAGAGIDWLARVVIGFALVVVAASASA